jgi:hypothetical protein
VPAGTDDTCAVGRTNGSIAMLIERGQIIAGMEATEARTIMRVLQGEPQSIFA